MIEIVKFWRTKGYKIVLYLDDVIGGASTFQEAKVVSSEIQQDLEKLVFFNSRGQKSLGSSTEISLVRVGLEYKNQ